MTEAAPRRHPAAFPVDDRRVYDAYVAGRQSAALAAGVRAGLFDLLDAEGPLDAPALARRLGWSARGVASMVGALRAMGLVVGPPDALELAPDAAAYLVAGRAGSLRGLVDMEVDHFLSPAALLAALEKDDASVYGDEDPWEAHAADPERARAFTAAMHAVSERPAAGFAEVATLGGARSLLDVGGGSAALSIAAARAHDELACVVWDLPVVCPLAEDYVAAAGLSDRVRAEPGDMFGEPFPAGHDAVLLSQILHDWPAEKGAVLLAKAFDALGSGGRVLIHEKLVADDGSGPLANALVHLDMLVWTEGQQYTESELRAMLAEAGFVDVTCRPTAGYWSLVEGVRP